MTPRDAGSGWTIDTLYEHFRSLIESNDRLYGQRFDSGDKAVAAALAAAKEAVTKAEITSDDRFKGVNEFRATLSDQQRTLMPRSEQETINRSLLEKLAAHEQRFDRLTGQRTGVRDVWGYVVAIAGLIIAALAVIFHKP